MLSKEVIFSQDWFSQHISQWKKDLSKFVGKENLKFIEVGTFEGRAAVWLLQNVLTHPSSKIICIDNWKFEDQSLKLDPSSMESTFDHNISAIQRESSVQKESGESVDILNTLSANSFDFIYIDGAHTAPAVLEDAMLSWKLLKKGGVMTFDDYTWGQAPMLWDRPKLAIDAFLSVFQGKYQLLHKNLQVTIQKIK